MASLTRVCLRRGRLSAGAPDPTTGDPGFAHAIVWVEDREVGPGPNPQRAALGLADSDDEDSIGDIDQQIEEKVAQLIKL